MVVTRGDIPIKTFVPLLFSLLLLAGQALYCNVAAVNYADSSTKMLAINEPAAARMTAAQKAEETVLVNNEMCALPGVEVSSCHIGGDEAARLGREGVLVGCTTKDNYLDLKAGNILFASDKDSVIATHLAKLSIRAGATVFVAESDNSLVIYDLLQTKPKQVSVLADKQKIVLEPARMLVLTKQATNDFEKLESNCHSVGYRNPQEIDLHSNTVKAFAADFSIASALVTIGPLKELMESPNKQDKLALERLIKAAVVLGDFANNAANPVQLSNNMDAQSNGTNSINVADAGKQP